MLRLLVLAVFVILILVFLAREILVFGQEKRSGAPEKPLLRRLRRRAKGLILLLGLFTLTAYYGDIAEIGHFDWRANLLFMGGILILMIWILIIAARDFRESALAIIRENEEITRETLQSLEKEMRERRRQQQDEEGQNKPDTQ